jgi:hypothetical protein
VPIKPMRVYEEMNKVFRRDTTYVTTIGLSQIAGAQFLHVYGPRQWINCGQAGPLGWTIPPRSAWWRRPEPHRGRPVGRLRLPVPDRGAGRGRAVPLPYVQVLVNNSYLGLIRQSQRGFEMDYCVQLAFENQNVTEDRVLQGYGVDHIKVVEGLGCKALRVTDPEKIEAACAGAGLDGASTGCRWWWSASSKGDQHRDGHRDRQGQRVRGHRLPPPRRRQGLEMAVFWSEAGTAMPRFAANLTMLFTEHPFLDRFERAAKRRLQGGRVPVSLRLPSGRHQAPGWTPTA